ncbi:MAG: Phage integrase family protein [Verrucomicrobiales bacterium]|nr:Phage integrase family protein [Verrucomicrobiales bacterium]
MKKRYRTYCRPSGTFYCFDTNTGKRESLKTKDPQEAEQLIQARNEALRQPAINFQIAKAYLSAADPLMNQRTWQTVFDEIIGLKHGSTRDRWFRASREQPFVPLLSRKLVETRAEHLLSVLRSGSVSANVHLRKLHNFCVDMNWVPGSIIPKKQWPPVHYKEKRGITLAEHSRIVERENNPEYKAFYALLWFLGGSQTDVATLQAQNIDWSDQTIAYARGKTDSTAMTHFGPGMATLLKTLPAEGPLFPRLSQMHERHRAKEFKRRCEGLGIRGVTLHSYRYAWAERARQVGYPERFAQEALGHNSKAVHRAYAKKAQVKVPSLEEFEHKVVSISFQTSQSGVTSGEKKDSPEQGPNTNSAAG